MAYIEPNTIVKFLREVPLDPDYENTLYFSSISEQTNYFYTKPGIQLDKQSYQRKNRGWIRVGWNADAFGDSVIENLYRSSYMMFKNTNFENKWFYAFVDRVEYVNNNTVDVQYHIDVMQTWHFDYTFNQCFIERQHVTNDNVGANTLPENLETGPYICDRPPYNTLLGETVYGGDFKYTPGLMLVTTFVQDPNDPDQFEYQEGRVIRGWGDMGKYFSGVDMQTYSLSNADIGELNAFLEAICEDEAKAGGVLSLSMIPLSLVHPQGQDYSYNDILFTRPTSLGTYTPRNKKLLTNPYNFMYVTNNQGQTGEFYWENGYNIGYLEFRMWANFSSNPAILCAPVEYKLQSGGNYDEMLTVSGFPMCAWTYDAFRAWCAQNQGTIVATGLTILGQWARAAISGVEARDAANNARMPGLTPRARTAAAAESLDAFNRHINELSRAGVATAFAVGTYYDHSRQPPQSVGNNNGNLLYQSSLMTFSFYRKYIKPEYARIIDSYFDMYGYAVHTVGIPNRAARPCYTYIKTIGCSLEATIPADDLKDIQEIYNNGIRFWKPSAVFGNYDPAVNNNAV